MYGFVYAAAHLSIYSRWDRDHNLRSLWTEIVSKPLIMFGAGAIVLLAPLAVTSTNGMIARLGNPRWKWLHTLMYPATALAAVHYYLEGKIVTLDKKIFAASVAAPLLFRWTAKLVFPEPKRALRARSAATSLPANRSATARKGPWGGQLKVARITRETPSVQTFRLALPQGGTLPFEHLPGQYLSLSLEIGGKKVRRSYTIASAPTQREYVELTSDATAFILVTSPARERMEETVNFWRLLKDHGMNVAAIVVNRVHTAAAGASSDELGSLAPALAKKLQETLQEGRLLADADQLGLAELARRCSPTPPVTVPRFEGDVHDLKGLFRTGEALFLEARPVP